MEISQLEFKQLLQLIEETKHESQEFKDGLHLGFRASIEIKRCR